MSNKDTKPAAEGIDLANIEFDANGEVTGLADDVLDAVSGGLMAEEESTNGSCPQANVGSCK